MNFKMWKSEKAKSEWELSRTWTDIQDYYTDGTSYPSRIVSQVYGTEYIDEEETEYGVRFFVNPQNVEGEDNTYSFQYFENGEWKECMNVEGYQNALEELNSL